MLDGGCVFETIAAPLNNMVVHSACRTKRWSQGRGRPTIVSNAPRQRRARPDHGHSPAAPPVSRVVPEDRQTRLNDNRRTAGRYRSAVAATGIDSAVAIVARITLACDRHDRPVDSAHSCAARVRRVARRRQAFAVRRTIFGRHKLAARAWRAHMNCPERQPGPATVVDVAQHPLGVAPPFPGRSQPRAAAVD